MMIPSHHIALHFYRRRDATWRATFRVWWLRHRLLIRDGAGAGVLGATITAVAVLIFLAEP